MSWRILVPDLAAACAALAHGDVPALAPRGTSLRRWAHWLLEEASTASRLEELPFWRGMADTSSTPLMDGTLDRLRDVAGAAGHVTLTLPAEVTGPLLTQVPAAFHGSTNDVLMTGLVVALADWGRRRGRDGGRPVVVDLHGHGRDAPSVGIDLSRTVGALTGVCPVRLDVGTVDIEDALAGGKSLGRALKLVKEQLRALPDHGLGYGLLRYLNPQTAAELRGLAPAQIAFGYLGRFGVPGGSDWGPAEHGLSLGEGDPSRPLSHAIEVTALAVDGEEGAALAANWRFAPALASEEAVRELAECWFAALTALVRHTETEGAGGRSPSDLPLLKLSQDEIERLERAYQ